MAKVFEHTDKIGRPITLGDFVAYAHGNDLKVGTITKVNEKMCRVQKIGKVGTTWRGKPDPGHLAYLSNMVLLDGPDVTMYLLTHGAKK